MSPVCGSCGAELDDVEPYTVGGYTRLLCGCCVERWRMFLRSQLEDRAPWEVAS